MNSKLVLGLFLVLIPSVVFSEGSTKEQSKKIELNCYMPYSVKKDHIVLGCEIEGYHMRYDLAQKNNIFMILLPNGYDSLDTSPVYFSIDTLSLDGHSLKDLFQHDIQGILKDRPGTKMVKEISHSIAKGKGECLGAELNYPKGSANFPFETYLVCDTGSKNYAIMLSMGARSKKELADRQEAFIKWVDVPQMVKDAAIHDESNLRDNQRLQPTRACGSRG